MSVNNNPTAILLATLLASLLPMFLFFIINIIFGVIAISMAKKRGLRTTPAFFAGLFGSFTALFYIALTPKKEIDSDLQ